MGEILQYREPKVIGFREFVNVYTRLSQAGTGSGPFHSASEYIPYHFTLRDGKVAEIEEQYIP